MEKQEGYRFLCIRCAFLVLSLKNEALQHISYKP